MSEIAKDAVVLMVFIVIPSGTVGCVCAYLWRKEK